MSKATKIWLIAATVLLLLGIMLFATAMTATGWKFTTLNTAPYETNEHTVSEEFHNIFIEADTADVRLLPSPDGACRVVCYEQKKTRHEVAVVDSTLTIRTIDEREWYEYIGISFDKPSVTIYLPQDAYSVLTVEESTGDVTIPDGFIFTTVSIQTSTGDVTLRASASGAVKIKTSTGDILAEDISVNALDLTVSTGRVAVSSVTCSGDLSVMVSTGDAQLTDTVCGEFSSTGDTGDITLRNVTVNGRLSIERSTGDVHFDGSDADSLWIKTSTGDVTGTLRSEKIFITSTDTGKIKVPSSLHGNRCDITTDTGNILLDIQP